MTDISLAYDAAAPAARSQAQPPLQRFRFTGGAREYFGIWVVNLFLTLVTLGIYSAWAKVRRKRYLYGSTWLAGSNFEYHGNPVAILKGRLIAVAAFVAYTLAANFSPRLGAVLLLAMMPAVPWLITRSFAFNAANSSYRNLRFRFTGTYREALSAIWPFFGVALVGVLVPQVEPRPGVTMVDVAFALLAPLLAAIAYPYVVARVKLLQGNRSAFGTARFECDAPVAAFYAIYIKSFVLFVCAAAMIVAFTLLTAGVQAEALVVVLPLGYFFLAAMLLAYTRARVSNRVLNATTLARQHRLVSTLSARELAKLYATNIVAITLTLGFAVPWAVIRTARYRAESLAIAGPDFDSFLGAVVRDVAATGEEVGEMFDVDLSL